MKTFFLLIFAALAFSCSNREKTNATEKNDTIAAINTAAEIKPELLITPGIAIGLTAIEDNTSKLETLGTPDQSDAAMGKAWMTWYGKKTDTTRDELNIYTTYKDNELKEKVVRQIRVTSPDFKTKDGISTESSFAEIQQQYPKLQTVGKYDNSDTKIETTIYDDVASGIAFEIKNPYGNSHCSAIIVHPKGKKVTDEYIYLNPYMIVL
ncbi:hypothetical protein [Flavobacterium pallidum]|uniref:Lipoprotein n=1 Tax=Flavobacterium pallidum TaxID=2172098 RepID=A0A2S1SKP2_9FLAO|nr:hypothetical protein [Flavobacterium pallidum]AWI26932.1 hypothetical protein HYN49_14040 [Flavobacterium pallidum]